LIQKNPTEVGFIVCGARSWT